MALGNLDIFSSNGFQAIPELVLTPQGKKLNDRGDLLFKRPAFFKPSE